MAFGALITIFGEGHRRRMTVMHRKQRSLREDRLLGRPCLGMLRRASVELKFKMSIRQIWLDLIRST